MYESRFDVITVDVDTGSILVPEAIVVPSLPEPFYADLLAALNAVRDPALAQDDLAFPQLPASPNGNGATQFNLDKGLIQPL